jgi:hypothetical protein
MSKFYYLFLTFILFPLQAQEFEWAKQFGGVGTTDVNEMMVDESGNIYLTGMFTQQSYIGDNPNENQISTNEFMSVFAVKMSSDGDVNWMKKVVGNDFNGGYYVYEGNDNTVYVVGSFSGSLFLDSIGGEGSFFTEGEDLFIMKLSEDGEFIWAKRLQGLNSFLDIGGIEVDDSGNFYLSGTFAGTIDFDLGDGVYNLNQIGYSDTFIAKYSPDWDLIWAKQLNDSGSTAIKVASNEIIVVGQFSGTCDFDPSDDQFFVTSNTLNDGYVLYLTLDGEFIKVNNTQGTGFSTISHIAADLDSEGNLYVIGSFFGEYDFNPNEEHDGEYFINSNYAFYNHVLKYNVDHELEWMKINQASNNGSVNGYDLTIDNQDQIYITGYLQNQVNFGEISVEQTSENYMQAFIARLNTQGEFDYAKVFGGESDVMVNYVKTDNLGNVYLTGTFEEHVNLNPDEDNFYVTARGAKDTYIIKLVVENMAMDNLINSQNILIYPNPAHNQIFVKTNSISSNSFEIFNMTGKLVKKGKFESNHPISISDIPKGLYIIKINNEHSFKLLKK